MKLKKFDFSIIGWDGELESISKLFESLANYYIDNKKYPKPEQQVSLENLLHSSEILKKWQEIGFRENSNSAYAEFQKKYKNFTDKEYEELRNEVDENGVFLPKNQILFRGVCSHNNNDKWKNPISTSLSPYIAILHALKNTTNKVIKIYIIQIGSLNNVKGIIGPFGEDVDFGQEFEVLIKPNKTPEVIDRLNIGNCLSVELLKFF